jgi:hypothetical protein
MAFRPDHGIMMQILQPSIFKARDAFVFSCICYACLLCLTATQTWADAAKPASGRIVKWVDEKGVTHYSDGIPPQYTGRDNAEINPQGVVIKRNKPALPQADNQAEEKINQQEIAQKRRDRSLLASYTTAQEIDLARERNLQMDEIAVQGLQQRKDNATSRLQAGKKTIDAYVKRNQTVPSDMLLSQADIKAEITRIDQQIAQKLASLEATRVRFDNDKQRFLELKSREPSLKGINQEKKSLSELTAWRTEAQERYDYYQRQIISAKRSGESPSEDLLKKLQNAQDEIKRAEQQIAQAQANISDSEKAFSDVKTTPPKTTKPKDKR